jgi:HD-like signal output (HDOD) protein
MRDEWEMEFVTTGLDALRILNERPFDVVVSDMKMHGLDGADLLNVVRNEYPEVVRIILSGNPDQALMFKSVHATHRYVPKPCDVNVLKNVIDRTLSLRSVLRGRRMKEFASRLSVIPSVPALYRQVLEELENPNCSLDRVGRVIAQDIGMSAKVLKVVNSAYFGLANPIRNVERAVSFLGLGMVRSLVLSVHIFAEYEGRPFAGFSLDSLWKHSLRTALCARALARAEGIAPDRIDDVFMAALLHDVGRLVLAANLPEEYEHVIRAREESVSPDLEREVFGATHDEVGAYLLGLWGLPDFILESIAFHSDSLADNGRTLDPRSVVHLADELVKEHDEAPAEPSPELVALGDRAGAWRDICRRILEQE